MNHYQQLTKFEREDLHVLIEQNLSNRKIAEILKRHPSTISREAKKIRWENPILLQKHNRTMSKTKRKVVPNNF